MSNQKNISKTNAVGLKNRIDVRKSSLPQYSNPEKSEPICAGKNDEEKISCFNSYLSQNTLSDDIVKSDDELKNYFIKNLDSLIFSGISRGKFDKYSNQDIVLISLEKHSSYGSGITTYVFLLEKDTTGKWKPFSKEFDYEEFINKPEELVKNEPAFFVSDAKDDPVGAGKGHSYIKKIYRLENGEFKSVLNIEYSNSKTNDLDQTEWLETGISYKDLDNDGSLEINKNGGKRTRTEEGSVDVNCFANDADIKIIKQEKINEVYKWDDQKQKFLKNK